MIGYINRALPTSSQSIRKTSYAFVVIAMLLNTGGWAMGEKYVEQGNKLSAAIHKELIGRGYCNNTPGNCFKVLPIYGEHGNRVNISVYAISTTNRAALNAIVNLIVEQGVAITQGVPISFTAYDSPHDDYVNLGIFRPKDPILSLEINK